MTINTSNLISFKKIVVSKIRIGHNVRENDQRVLEVLKKFNRILGRNK